MSPAQHEGSPVELAAVREAESLGLPFVRFRDGERAQHILQLEGERMTVGRDAGNELSLHWDRQASRLHALFERLGESWVISDDGLSRNGTLVNGARVRGRRRLSDHDIIRIGSTQILFRDPGGASEETAPAAGDSTLAVVTAAQRRVLVALCRPLLVDGATSVSPPSNAEIATELAVSVEAVRSQLKSLFRLFEIPDLPQNRKRAELARRALIAGVVLPKDV